MNLIGAAGAAFFAQATLRFYLQTHRLIGGAFFAEQMWVVVAYLIRRPARDVSRRWGDWLLAFGGTFGGVLFRPDGAHPQWGVTTGLAVQLVGLAICVASFLALGRSFGFVAADRGLVQTRSLRRRPPSHLRLLPPPSVRVRAAEHLAAQRPRDGVRVGLQRRPSRRRGPRARDERALPSRTAARSGGGCSPGSGSRWRRLRALGPMVREPGSNLAVARTARHRRRTAVRDRCDPSRPVPHRLPDDPDDRLAVPAPGDHCVCPRRDHPRVGQPSGCGRGRRVRDRHPRRVPVVVAHQPLRVSRGPHHRRDRGRGHRGRDVRGARRVRPSSVPGAATLRAGDSRRTGGPAAAGHTGRSVGRHRVHRADLGAARSFTRGRGTSLHEQRILERSPRRSRRSTASQC